MKSPIQFPYFTLLKISAKEVTDYPITQLVKNRAMTRTQMFSLVFRDQVTEPS